MVEDMAAAVVDMAVAAADMAVAAAEVMAAAVADTEAAVVAEWGPCPAVEWAVPHAVAPWLAPVFEVGRARPIALASCLATSARRPTSQIARTPHWETVRISRHVIFREQLPPGRD